MMQTVDSDNFLSNCMLIIFKSSTAYILSILHIFYSNHSRQCSERDKAVSTNGVLP